MPVYMTFHVTVNCHCYASTYISSVMVADTAVGMILKSIIFYLLSW